MSIQDETNPNAPAGDPAEPSVVGSGATYDTTEDNLGSPLEPYRSPTDDAVLQVQELADYLAQAFPDEVALTNRQYPERPVDTAKRLLQALVSKTPPSQVSRCGQEYCNKPAGHTDEHGWIQAD